MPINTEAEKRHGGGGKKMKRERKKIEEADKRTKT
jgi:hypothetical protein